MFIQSKQKEKQTDRYLWELQRNLKDPVSQMHSFADYLWKYQQINPHIDSIITIYY